MTDTLPLWCAYHLYYHADLNRMLCLLVRPLVRDLVQQGIVDRFYFIRYHLGGPHLRLRFRRVGGHDLHIEAKVADHAQEFFTRFPSSTPQSAERIHYVNQTLIHGDPAAGPEGDVVYPDNSWARFEPVFEMERYGGPAVFPATLELFTISSAAVLELIERGNASRQWANAAMMKLAVPLAWGLSGGNDNDGIALAGYATDMFADACFMPCIRHADAVFARAPKLALDLVRGQLRELGAAEREPGLGAAASRLAEHLAGLSRETRLRAGRGQIHMTANRLGLVNPEEVYACRMLVLAMKMLREQDDPLWLAAWSTHPAVVRTAGISGPNSIAATFDAGVP